MCTVHHGFHEGLDLRKAEVVRAIQEMGAAGEGLAGAESERLFHAFEVLQADSGSTVQPMPRRISCMIVSTSLI